MNHTEAATRYDAAMERVFEIDDWDSRLPEPDRQEIADALSEGIKAQFEHAAATWPAKVRALVDQSTADQICETLSYIQSGFDMTGDLLNEMRPQPVSTD
ncbi:hypothetical protein IMZ11_41400 [Microtetraspora sp. AC03309]|uniref:hypothetical protein n=1 Tax=Microtetraspora sp. AC03309 TaxID=2779376 RepID=UPI001E2ED1AD|nr:hypothetical protein [Microtetraspora sp. AC03309]MCC5582073.1 hypothetical protein [Microtetraspora sp. AC03309]